VSDLDVPRNRPYVFTDPNGGDWWWRTPGDIAAIQGPFKIEALARKDMDSYTKMLDNLKQFAHRL
jgi:hypothetical protein